jgi:hypothetical protein
VVIQRCKLEWVIAIPGRSALPETFLPVSAAVVSNPHLVSDICLFYSSYVRRLSRIKV